MVAKSLLLDAGIPFTAQGERLQELVEPGRIGTNFSVPLGTVKLQVQAEDIEDARKILCIEKDKTESENRVQELERSLMGKVVWFILFFLGGLVLAYLFVPGVWDEGMRTLIYITVSFCAAFLGVIIRKSRGYDQIPEDETTPEDNEPIQPSINKKKYIFVIVIVALSFLFLFYYFGSVQETDKNTEKNMSESEIKRRLERYKQAIAQNPDDASYHYSAGTLYLMLKIPQEALPYLNRAIELNPTCVDCFFNRALAYSQLGNYDQTIKDFSRIIDLDPHHKKIADVYHGRAYAYYTDHQFWQAIKDYDKTIDLDPQRTDAYLGRGNSYGQFINDHKRAISDYNKALEIDPKNARAYWSRAYAYNEIGQYDEAFKDYNKSIELNPKTSDVYNASAWFLATCKDSKYRDGKKAVQYAQKAVEHAEKNKDNQLVEYYDTLAAAYAEAGDFDKAVLTQSKTCELYKQRNADDKTQIECRQLIEAYREKQTYNQWENKNSKHK